MNISFKNWQLINPSNLLAAFNGGFNEMESFLNSFDEFGYQNNTIETNTRIAGTTFSGLSYDMIGRNFTDDAPTSTVTSLSLNDATRNALFTGSVTYNYETDLYSGFYNKLSYNSNNTNLLALGTMSVDVSGELSNATYTQLNITSNGYKYNLTGNMAANSNGDLVGGTISSFTLSDNLGNSFSASGLTLSAATFDSIVDPATSPADFSALFNLLNSSANLSGNDLITGDTSNNNILGFAGNDTLDGGEGADTMIGGDGNDTYYVDNQSDVAIETNSAASGIDTVFSKTDIYTLGQNIENLTLLGNSNISAVGNDLANIIKGNDGDNFIEGFGGADTVYGGAGNDYYEVNLIKKMINGKATIALEDTIIDSSGTDEVLIYFDNVDGTLETPDFTTIVLANGLERINAQFSGATKLNLTGNAAANVITGNDADNILLDSTGNDTLNGGAGNDTLDGGIGSDLLVGGTGNDTYLVDIEAITSAPTVPATPIVVTGARLQDIITEDNGTTDGIDTLKLRGSVVIPALTAAQDIALAGALANIENLDVSATGTTRLNITGNAADNKLTGNTANNVLTGGDGFDTLDGGAGADTMDGGNGNDTYVIDNLGDVIIADSSGTDTAEIRLATGTYAIAAGSGIENIVLAGAAAINATGDAGANNLAGNTAANILNGGAGADTMTGGDGADIYIVDDVDNSDGAVDVVNETNALAAGGIDTVRANLQNDQTYTLTANVENLTLTDNINTNGGTANSSGTGNALNNTITGNAGNNILNGEAGNDTLLSGDGNDTLTGGAGVDALIGGKGNDTYFIDLVRANVPATSTVALQDTVNELANTAGSTVEGIDKIILTNLTGNTGAPTDFSNITNATTLTVNANIEEFDASQTGNIKINITGNAAANVITGNDADNILLDSTGNDTLNGGSGNDILDGGIGSDLLVGGIGNDTYLVDIEAITSAPTVPATPIVVTGVKLQDAIDEANGITDGIDTLKLRGNVVIPATVPNAQELALTGALANIENLDISATGTTRLNITGNAENNILIGNSTDNFLFGLDGNDTLDGGIGADILYGGDGDDTYIIDNTWDLALDYSTGNDTIRTTISINLEAPFDNTSNLKYVGIENVYLIGTAAVNLTGSNYTNNKLYGNDAANIINGGIGFGYSGTDTMDGGKGADTYIVDSLDDEVSEQFTLAQGGGIDLVKSHSSFTLGNNIENLTLQDVGVNGNDNINGTGNDLANIITGNAARNTLDGKAGADRMIGGGGDDTYYVDNIGDVVIENASTLLVYSGIDTVNSEISYLLGANLENLTLIGDEDIIGTGNTLANTIIGNAGDNLLDGGASTTIIDTLSGGAGNDIYVVDLAITGTADATAFTIQDTFTEAADQGTDTLRLRGTLGYLTAKSLFVNDYAGQSIEGLDISLTGSSKINLTGNGTDNVLVGNAFTNTLIGDAGNDMLDGKAGADIMDGGIGNDTYFVDVIKPTVGLGGDVIIEDNIALNFGHDTVNTTFSADLKSSQFDGIENLTLLGTAALNATGDEANNELIGNDGANILDGGAGADDMDGGKGNDTYIVDNLGDDVSELYTAAQGGGIDLVKSSVDFELDDNIENLTLTDGTINGGTKALNGTGNELANIIIGNAGANIIDGDDGADKMTGGDGNDTYYVDDIGDIVTETNANITIGGNDTVVSEISYVLGANLENLTLSDDYDINGTGNTLANNIVGNAGDNVLDGGASTTITDTLTGGAGNDTYVVDITTTGTGNATLFAVQDVVNETSGAINDVDTLKLRGTLGYTTTQTLTVAALNSIANVSGSIEGIDVSLTGVSKINLLGTSGNNNLVGNTFTNSIDGGDGDDILDGKAGADTLNGGAGDDTYFVDVIKPATGSGGDVIIEDNITLNFGGDTVNTTFSADLNSTQFDGIENLTLLAGALNATGDAGDNELIGNASANTIKGGAGEDEITGGAGNDILTGGAGADTFVWELADKGANGLPSKDAITDFSSSEDKLDIRDLLVGENSSNIANFLDITTSTAAGVTSTEIRISNTGGFVGGNFSAAAENAHITLTGVNLLTGTNEADLLANLISQNKLIID